MVLPSWCLTTWYTWSILSEWNETWALLPFLCNFNRETVFCCRQTLTCPWVPARHMTENYEAVSKYATSDEKVSTIWEFSQVIWYVYKEAHITNKRWTVSTKLWFKAWSQALKCRINGRKTLNNQGNSASASLQLFLATLQARFLTKASSTNTTNMFNSTSWLLDSGEGKWVMVACRHRQAKQRERRSWAGIRRYCTFLVWATFWAVCQAWNKADRRIMG